MTSDILILALLITGSISIIVPTALIAMLKVVPRNGDTS